MPRPVSEGPRAGEPSRRMGDEQRGQGGILELVLSITSEAYPNAFARYPPFPWSLLGGLKEG